MGTTTTTGGVFLLRNQVKNAGDNMSTSCCVCVFFPFLDLRYKNEKRVLTHVHRLLSWGLKVRTGCFKASCYDSSRSLVVDECTGMND